MKGDLIMEKLNELDKKIDNLNINVAKLNTKIAEQDKTMGKLMEGLDKLTTYIEKTNENNKKIDTLFRMIDRINANGTKHCPVNVERINKLEKQMERLNNWIITVVIAVILQFLGIIVHFVDKNIHF